MRQNFCSKFSFSSTRIRKALLENNFSLAKELLGRPYTFAGKVVHGQHLGRTIGVPTANIWLPRQNLPISGVYAVRTTFDGKSFDGIANMGVRPTVGGSNPVLEVHLFNFDQEIWQLLNVLVTARNRTRLKLLPVFVHVSLCCVDPNLTRSIM